METQLIIIVSVLSTLGVVALVSAIVVAFFKLRRKVDVQYMNTEVENIYKMVGESQSDLQECIDQCHKDIDSRCDKLYSKIEQVEKSAKANS
jgi:peptidoglycan hydrolase CwlO-like protein